MYVLIGELGVSQAFLARWYIGGGCMNKYLYNVRSEIKVNTNKSCLKETLRLSVGELQQRVLGSFMFVFLVPSSQVG